MMWRFRRYRVFLIFAVLLTILFYHVSLSSDWDLVVPVVDGLTEETLETAIAPADHRQAPLGAEETSIIPKPPSQFPSPIATEPKPTTSSSAGGKETVDSPALFPTGPTKTVDLSNTIPQIAIPDRKPTIPHDENPQFELHSQSPGRLDKEVVFTPLPPIHWEPQKEHFPVPTESIIQLPTGKPISIPKIQYDFPPESAEAKAAREEKKNIIRNEAKRAWAGYKKYAWMHDELMPVSGKFKDPFCGWAATLVDSLDTLWIMNLIPEFEEAVKAVDSIDFTTSSRSDIPMFETTIRYLGGLLAAYDISGAKYKSLLDKAVELAEILYSAFDTPNRMPLLYYQWKPTYASQPHRASNRAGTAELGSMAMEFTRLAQLTKEPRYYDAIARITNALEEFQNRGTGLDGVFPDDLDASGCNWTKPAIPAHVEEPRGYEPAQVALPQEFNSKLGMSAENEKKLEFQVIPGADGSGLSKARIQGWEEHHIEDKKEGNVTMKAGGSKIEVPLKQMKRQLNDPSLSLDPTLSIDKTPQSHKSGSDGPRLSTDLGDTAVRIPTKASTTPTWDCVRQGLVGANSKYSMGAGQDSTYEYFPKQFLLLGGLEDKYRTMYLKTIDAVRQHMLFRPMIPGDHDVLFSGEVVQSSVGTTKFQAESTHLTCFIGGMVGMSAKIFNIEGDLEIAKRLTDGCVWAYESMPSGIMAEGSRFIPCESVTSCSWNETLYYEALDPTGATRREELREEYFKKKMRTEAEVEADRLAEAAKAASDAKDAAVQEEADRLASIAKTAIDVKNAGSTDEAAMVLELARSERTPNLDIPNSKPSENSPKPIQKRQLNVAVEEKILPVTHNLAEEAYKESKAAQDAGATTSNLKKVSSSAQTMEETGIGGVLSGKIPVVDVGFEKKLQQTEQELEAQNPRGNTYDPARAKPGIPTAVGQSLLGAEKDPYAPMSHKEYVESRIKNENLPLGYVSVDRREYILRPEAIESVFYMYRITGDPIWRTKGWTMWLAIMKSCAAEYGHSAISDVTVDLDKWNTTESPLPNVKKDAMESFWLAETLKYFYLLFEEEGVVSLDEWVLNTEAHPFRRGG